MPYSENCFQLIPYNENYFQLILLQACMFSTESPYIENGFQLIAYSENRFQMIFSIFTTSENKCNINTPVSARICRNFFDFPHKNSIMSINITIRLCHLSPIAITKLLSKPIIFCVHLKSSPKFVLLQLVDRKKLLRSL